MSFALILINETSCALRLSGFEYLNAESATGSALPAITRLSAGASTYGTLIQKAPFYYYRSAFRVEGPHGLGIPWCSLKISFGALTTGLAGDDPFISAQPSAFPPVLTADPPHVLTMGGNAHQAVLRIRHGLTHKAVGGGHAMDR